MFIASAPDLCFVTYGSRLTFGLFWVNKTFFFQVFLYFVPLWCVTSDQRLRITEINFTNVLRAAFVSTDPKSTKRLNFYVFLFERGRSIFNADIYTQILPAGGRKRPCVYILYSDNLKTLEQEDDIIVILKRVLCCYKENSFTIEIY